MYNNRKNNSIFVKKPEFVEIANIYDGLERLVDEFGVEKVLLHLGLVISKKISRQFASKIWNLVQPASKSDAND